MEKYRAYSLSESPLSGILVLAGAVRSHPLHRMQQTDAFCEFDGVVKEICVKSGEPVEYDQTLIIIG